MKAPPPHHGGGRAPLLSKVSVKTPPLHHGGDNAPLSSNHQNQQHERKKHQHFTIKEQAQVIEYNIRLNFESSLILHSTTPHHNPQSLLSATKLHMAGDSKALATIQASTLRQLLESAPVSLLSELEEMVVFDTGAAQAVSYDRKYFVGTIRTINERLAAIGAELDVAGIGMISVE